MTRRDTRFAPHLFVAAMLILGGCYSGWQLWNHYFNNSMPLAEALRGVVLPQSRPLAPFTLVDHFEKPFDLERLKGRWSFIFFGYTHCPDVCPFSLGLLTEMRAYLQDQPEILRTMQVIFVSVDPDRDTPALLKGYVSHFHKDFMGVTGLPEEIRRFAEQMQAGYKISTEVDEAGHYAVSHSSAFYLVDPRGDFVAVFQSRFHPPQQMARVFAKIRAGLPPAP